MILRLVGSAPVVLSHKDMSIVDLAFMAIERPGIGIVVKKMNREVNHYDL